MMVQAQPRRSFIQTFTFFAFLLSSFRPVIAGVYTKSDDIQGEDFFNKFQWEAIRDPTHGNVRYVDQAEARQKGLTVVNGNSFRLGADSKTRLAPGIGRDSARISSVARYTTHVAVFDIEHMPEGCGTWPAIWTVGDNWPRGGEIDILEGVNNQEHNGATLHTNEGCSMPRYNDGHLGQRGGVNCDVVPTGNAGCSVVFPNADSYGPPFNAAGGGWYAMERTSSFIKIWHWSRNGRVPNEVRNGATSINTDQWGTPMAFFPNDQCNMDTHFGPHNIIINLTFCGDWAGQNEVFSRNCPGTCNEYVNNNPEAFRAAYFDLAAVRIYTPGGKYTSSSQTPSNTTSAGGDDGTFTDDCPIDPEESSTVPLVSSTRHTSAGPTSSPAKKGKEGSTTDHFGSPTAKFSGGPTSSPVKTGRGKSSSDPYLSPTRDITGSSTSNLLGGGTGKPTTYSLESDTAASRTRSAIDYGRGKPSLYSLLSATGDTTASPTDSLVDDGTGEASTDSLQSDTTAGPTSPAYDGTGEPSDDPLGSATSDSTTGDPTVSLTDGTNGDPASSTSIPVSDNTGESSTDALLSATSASPTSSLLEGGTGEPTSEPPASLTGDTAGGPTSSPASDGTY